MPYARTQCEPVAFAPFSAWHLIRISHLVGRAPHVCKTWPEYADFMEKVSCAYTMFLGDRPIACGGIGLLHPGVGKAWAYLTDEARRRRPAYYITRGAQRRLFSMAQKLNLHRIECETPLRNLSFQRWIDDLRFIHPETGELKKFEFEAIKKHYGSKKEDYVGYYMLL